MKESPRESGQTLRSSLDPPRLLQTAPPDRSRSRLTLGQDNPETDGGAPALREAAVAVRRPAALGEEGPAAAANHADPARSSPLRIGHTPGGILPIPVLTPLRHVPNHVIQPPSVRCITPYRRRLTEVNPAGVSNSAHRRIVFVLAIEVPLSRVQTTPQIERRRRPRASRILPLRFRR